MRCGLLIKSLFSLGLMLGAAQAEERMSRYGEARGWVVFAITEGPRFLRCSAVHPEGELGLDEGPQGYALSLSLGAAQSESFYTIMDVDGRRFEGSFVGAGGDRHRFPLVPLEVEALRQGNNMDLNISSVVSSWSLYGAAAAITKLEECYDRAGGYAVAPPPPPPPPPPPQVDSDAQQMGAGCPQPMTLRSAQSNAAATVEFVNLSDRALSLYWLDFNGMPVEYAGLLPGESSRMTSYIGHFWVMKDFDFTCHGGALVVSQPYQRFEVR